MAVYSELLKSVQIITGNSYWQQLVQPNCELTVKQFEYTRRLDRVLFQNDNSQSHVSRTIKVTLERWSEWMYYPTPIFLQTLRFRITTCLNTCRITLLTSTKVPLKVSKKGSMNLPPMNPFFT